jgi:GTP cyclohydrolase II
MKQNINRESLGLDKATVRNRVRVPFQNMGAEFVSFYHLADDKEHIALDFRKDPNQTPLVRIHSECLTGDVFHSNRCDCGEQLQEAVKLFAKDGGVLLYLRQEGRGIGLYNKLDAYELQMKGHDTYEANRLLGLHDDQRDYLVAAQMLNAMNIKTIRLLSNNPQKRLQLLEYGIDVIAQQSTGVFGKAENLEYLKAKALHTGHHIAFEKISL